MRRHEPPQESEQSGDASAEKAPSPKKDGGGGGMLDGAITAQPFTLGGGTWQDPSLVNRRHGALTTAVCCRSLVE